MSADEVQRLRRLILRLCKMSPANKYPVDDEANLRALTVAALTGAIANHAGAMVSLCRDVNRLDSAKVLLRTMIETWIVAEYIALDTNGRHAARYVMTELQETERLLKGLRAILDEDPLSERHVLGAAGLGSITELDERLEAQRAQIQELRKKGAHPLPNMANCAKEIGQELTYRTVYGYLLSGSVHARAGTTLRPMLDQSPERIETYKILATGAFVLTKTLIASSSCVGEPHRKKLRFAERLLQQFAADMSDGNPDGNPQRLPRTDADSDGITTADSIV